MNTHASQSWTCSTAGCSEQHEARHIEEERPLKLIREVGGSSISSTRTPHTTPLMSEVFGCMAGAWAKKDETTLPDL